MKRRLERSKEEGYWSMMQGQDGSVYVSSSDFTHDASLQVLGDFKDYDERVKYAQLIARRLNKGTKLELSKRRKKCPTTKT